MLAYFFPREAASFLAQEQDVGNARLWAGIHYRSDLEAGFAVAHGVSGLVIAHAEADGSP